MVSEAKKQLPIRPGYFELPSSPGEETRLVGALCRPCSEYFFPARSVCLRCGREGLEPVALSSRGKVWTFTVVHMPPPGSLVTAPYVVAVVELPEGPLVPTVLTGCDPSAVRIGMEAEMYVEKVGEDENGNQLMAYKFKAA